MTYFNLGAEQYRLREYILLLFILVLSGGWIVVTRTGNDFLFFLVIFYLGINCLIRKGVGIDIPYSYLVLFSLVFISSFFQDFYFDEKEVFILIKAFAAVLCCLYFRLFGLDLLRLFTHLMYVVSIVSVVLFFIIFVAPFLLVSVDSDYLTLFGLSFVRNSDLLRFGEYRNQAFFWEAGVYGVMLSLAYAFNEIFYKRKNFRVAFFVAAITTRSMGALLILIPSAIYFYIYKKNKQLAKLYMLTGVLVSGFIVFVPELIDDVFVFLFDRSFFEDASLTVRVNDLFVGVKAAQDSLLLGRPSGDFDSYNELLIELHGYTKGDDSGITNSIVSLLYKFGIPVVVSYCVSIYCFSRRVAKENAWFLTFFMIALLMIEPLALSLFFLAILSWRPIVHTR